MKITLHTFATLAFTVAILGIALLTPPIQSVFSQAELPENQNFLEAVENLQILACRQKELYAEKEHFYPDACTSRQTVCNNSPSLVGSTKDLKENLAIDLTHTTIENGGDVRYRCRLQGSQLYCFAFRCDEADPAGCKQLWRIKYKYTTNEDRLVWTDYAKCFDMGVNNKICSLINEDHTFPCE